MDRATETRTGILARLLATDDLEQIRCHITALLAESFDPWESRMLEQARAAHTVTRAHHYLRRLVRGIETPRTNGMNDINLRRWEEYADIITDSLWIEPRRDGSGAHRADYWGNFIPQIPNQLVRRFTRVGGLVFEPFVGSGTTAIECQRLGRDYAGFELLPEVADKARQRVAEEVNHHGTLTSITTADSTCADYTALLASTGHEQVDLAIVHPPYFNIIPFSDRPEDLSQAPSVAAFLDGMRAIFEHTRTIMGPSRYMGLVIGDIYRDGTLIPLGFQTMHTAMEAGFSLQSTIVKNVQDTRAKRGEDELWRYRALAGGFYRFRHEYIFVFRTAPQRARRTRSARPEEPANQ